MNHTFAEMLEAAANSQDYIELAEATRDEAASELQDQWNDRIRLDTERICDPDTTHEGGNATRCVTVIRGIEPLELWVKLGDRDGAICPGTVNCTGLDARFGRVDYVLTCRMFGTPDGGETIWALYEASLKGE